ncbi:MAG: hypothetical protein BWX63_01804 [Bacteroidetes bacterium ADurb.Bin041]|nr:MAG: hypothetical protein BWX63_01804 [Bacteroidetes bacterium ADurb.Bin041]
MDRGATPAITYNKISGITEIIIVFFEKKKENIIAIIDVIAKTLNRVFGFVWDVIRNVGKVILWVIDVFNNFITALGSGNVAAVVLTGAIGSLTSAIALYWLWMKKSIIAAKAKLIWDSITALWTNILTAAWWKLNLAMLANPIVWIIAGVIALIGGIAYLIMKIDGWRATWDNLIKFLKITWDIFRAGFNLGWLRIEDTFLTGIETLMRAWYKLQALWDKEGAKAGLTAMENRQNERAEQIAASYGKLQDLIDQRGKIDVFQLKWNDKKLSDITGNLKRKFGIGELSPSSVVSASDIPTSFAPTNVVTENVTNTITGGGRQMKNITFNIGSLVGENTNNFLPGEGPEDADDFMRKLTNALQLVMNDVNYAN